MKTAVLFSGQGSQYVGMMKDLAENFSTASHLIAQADEILGYSLSKICFEGPTETLKETRYTQPAIFLHEVVLVELLRGKISPEAVAGHSLGEYSALYCAGVLDFEAALQLVQLRANLMFGAGEEKPGTMFAVIGLADEKVEQLCSELSVNGNIVVPANYNSPGQLVVSGSQEWLRANASQFKQAGARMVVELPVSGAFHSPLLESAREKLAKAITETSFNNALIDVYCNVNAQPQRGANELKQLLIAQLTSPVKWTQILQNLHSSAFTNFIEIGPGNVLQGLVKRTLSEVSISGFDKAASVLAVS